MCIRRYLSPQFLAVAVSAGIAAQQLSAGPPDPPSEYRFVPRPDVNWYFKWGADVHVVTIDARGVVRLVEKVPANEATRIGNQRVKGAIVSFPDPVRVYEFRSGRLILGTMMPDGEFVPEAGSTVIKFEDYRFGRGPHIWNLPGYFEKKKAPADGKPEKD